MTHSERPPQGPPPRRPSHEQEEPADQESASVVELSATQRQRVIERLIANEDIEEHSAALWISEATSMGTLTPERVTEHVLNLNEAWRVFLCEVLGIPRTEYYDTRLKKWEEWRKEDPTKH